MKATHSREFYIKNWDRYIQRVPGGSYINLAEELERTMRTFDGIGLDENALATIERLQAQEIIARADKKVREQMATIKAVEAGRASFGYTTQRQEIEARAAFRTRFEFNCLQIALFREKYDIH